MKLFLIFSQTTNQESDQNLSLHLLPDPSPVLTNQTEPQQKSHMVLRNKIPCEALSYCYLKAEKMEDEKE